MDQREQPIRSAREHPTVVVEIVRAVPPSDVPAIARRVARSLLMREARVRRLLHARVGPITRPLRLEKAEILRRVLEQEGVSVTTRPSGIAGSPPDPQRRGGDHPAVERSDAFVTAALAAMVSVAVADGPASDAGLEVVGAELQAMTGTDVGSERIDALARSRGAGNLLQVHELLAELAPSLSDEEKRSILDMLHRVVAAGSWSVVRARGVVHLAGALGMLQEAVSETTERARVLLA